ncbi:MAG: hypothetical protein ACXWE4_02585 [Methylobacter sp.]
MAGLVLSQCGRYQRDQKGPGDTAGALVGHTGVKLDGAEPRHEIQARVQQSGRRRLWSLQQVVVLPRACGGLDYA